MNTLQAFGLGLLSGFLFTLLVFLALLVGAHMGKEIAQEDAAKLEEAKKFFKRS